MKALTWHGVRITKTGQTHTHRYLAPLLRTIENGKIDRSFVITHSRPPTEGPELYKTSGTKRRLHQGRSKALTGS
jgi:threonine dehydrogenase-like Zn-dependent dehydrogenase